MGHGPDFALQAIHRAFPRGPKLFACESRGADQGDGAHNSGQLSSLDGWIHLGRWSNQNGLYVHNSFLFELHLVILIITLLNFWLNAALAYDPAVLEELERDFSTVGHLTLNFTAENPAAVLMKIKDFYLGADAKFTKENFDKITRVIKECNTYLE